MKRRALMQATAAALAAPALGGVAGKRVVRIVPHTNLASMDPIWTLAVISRNHGYLVYDTLFGMTLDFRPTPQMAEGLLVEDDGRTVTIGLREGLAFHDGESVRAADCIASIARWGKRNAIGQKLASVTDELTALDDRRLQFRLKRPFPLLANALANVGQPAFIMPERIAGTDPFKQIVDATGSGPFRFNPQEFLSGHRVVYDRNPAYIPVATGEPSLTSGPKRAFVDRVEWHVIPDAATAAAALQRGEVDWYEQPPPEQLSLLRQHASISVERTTPFPSCGLLRFNFLHPPFNNKAVRKALLPAIEQADFMTAINGTDEGAWQEAGIFTPGTAMATAAGLEPLRGPRDVERSRRLLREAGYNDELMRLVGPTDILGPTALTQVGADLFRRLGFNMDLALSDWGTVLQKRGSHEPVERGGWSAFLTNFPGVDFIDPGTHPSLSGNGAGPGSYSGWPTIPRLEELRENYFNAADGDTRKAVCADLQRVVMDEVAFVPLGAFTQFTAVRRDISDRLPGVVVFWNLKRS